MMSEPILKIENLHVVYKTDESTVYAVNGVDLELFSGETLDILSSYPSTAPSGTASSALRMLLYQLHSQFRSFGDLWVKQGQVKLRRH